MGFETTTTKSCLHAISLLSVLFPMCSACCLFLQHLSVRGWTDRWSFSTFSLPLSALGPAASLCLFMHLYLKGNRLYFNCTWTGDDNKMLITFFLPVHWSLSVGICPCWSQSSGTIADKQTRTRRWHENPGISPIVPRLLSAFPFQQLHAAPLMWNCSAHMLIPIFIIPAIPAWELMWDFFWIRRRCLFFLQAWKIFSLLKPPWNGPFVYPRGILGSQQKAWSCSNTYPSYIASCVL